MINQILLYIGGALCTIWGVTHLFPTRNVVNDFGDITEDNKYIITMEWIVEGVSLIFIGILVGVVTMIDFSSTLARVVYWVTVAELNLLSLVSLFTGFKVNFLPFKLCPLIFTVSSILIVLGILL
jgi:hypothetical protein